MHMFGSRVQLHLNSQTDGHYGQELQQPDGWHPILRETRRRNSIGAQNQVATRRQRRLEHYLRNSVSGGNPTIMDDRQYCARALRYVCHSRLQTLHSLVPIAMPERQILELCHTISILMAKRKTTSQSLFLRSWRRGKSAAKPPGQGPPE